MKKRLSIAIMIALVASMAFAACGNSPAPAGEPSSTSIAESSAEPSSQPPSEPSSESESVDAQSEEPATEEDEDLDSSDITVYAAEMQEMLDALSELFGDAMKIETSTEGNNTLVITYTLLNDSLGLTAEAIAESMEAEGAKMENLTSQMESGGISSPVIIVKWIDVDGSELFIQEYK